MDCNEVLKSCLGLRWLFSSWDPFSGMVCNSVMQSWESPVSLLCFLSEPFFAFVHAYVDPSLRRGKDMVRRKGHTADGLAAGQWCPAALGAG